MCHGVSMDLPPEPEPSEEQLGSIDCLACHAYSGGGPHFKRPNLSPDLYDADETSDVHMARGLSCIDCHKAVDHTFPTKSTDTWNREEGHIPQCTDCHGQDSHGGLKGWILNTFHDRVACQVCHIPYIAHGEYPTDMYRNWTHPEFVAEAAKYEPQLDLRKMVEPVYAWYNGTRKAYLYPAKIELENGKITYLAPLGSKDDHKAKIYHTSYTTQ